MLDVAPLLLQVVEMRAEPGRGGRLARAIAATSTRLAGQGVERVEARTAIDDPDRVLALLSWRPSGCTREARAAVLAALADLPVAGRVQVLHQEPLGPPLPAAGLPIATRSPRFPAGPASRARPGGRAVTNPTKMDQALAALGTHRGDAAREAHLCNIGGLVETMLRYGNERGDPVRVVQGYLGDRWSSLIMHLLHGGALRFGGLRRLIQVLAAESTISHQVLAQKLRTLQRDGFVSRSLLKDPSPRVEYELTAIGRGAYAQFSALVRWSQEMTDAIRAARAAYDAGTPEGDEPLPDDA